MDNQNISVFSVCGWFCIPVKEHNAVIIKLSCKRPPFMSDEIIESPVGNDSNLLIVFYVQIMPDDFVMQLHRF